MGIVGGGLWVGFWARRQAVWALRELSKGTWDYTQNVLSLRGHMRQGQKGTGVSFPSFSSIIQLCSQCNRTCSFYRNVV